MPQPTLQEAYGNSVSIEDGELTIKLSEIYPGGMVPLSPTSESILIAILNHYHDVSDTGANAEVVVTRSLPTTLSQGASNYVVQEYSIAIKQGVSLDIAKL